MSPIAINGLGMDQISANWGSPLTKFVKAFVCVKLNGVVCVVEGVCGGE